MVASCACSGKCGGDVDADADDEPNGDHCLLSLHFGCDSTHTRRALHSSTRTLRPRIRPNYLCTSAVIRFARMVVVVVFANASTNVSNVCAYGKISPDRNTASTYALHHRCSNVYRNRDCLNLIATTTTKKLFVPMPLLSVSIVSTERVRS